MEKKEEIKKFLKEQFGERFRTESELDEFAEELLKSAEKQNTLERVRYARVWKKEEIELLGIEVTPVDWKQFD
ncbi:MAG: hypothetical protein ABGX31_05665 [bacterium]|jgi:hypothetical protein